MVTNCVLYIFFTNFVTRVAEATPLVILKLTQKALLGITTLRCRLCQRDYAWHFGGHQRGDQQ